MLPTQITDHFDQAIDRKIEHYSGVKPVFDGVAFAHIDQLQQLEDEIWKVIYGRCLDPAPGQSEGARGNQLDILGKLVGIKRQGYTDDEFVAAIRLQILINHSFGRFDDLLTIVRTAIGISGVITAYERQYHHVAYFRLDHISDVLALVLYRSLQKARAAGYRAMFEYYTDSKSPLGLALAGWTDSDGNAASGVTGQGGFGWTDSNGDTSSGVAGGFFTSMQG